MAGKASRRRGKGGDVEIVVLCIVVLCIVCAFADLSVCISAHVGEPVNNKPPSCLVIMR